MAIVKCENTKCKYYDDGFCEYYDDGFYCTRFIVEMTDGMCDYWTEQKKLTKDQREMRKIVEECAKYGIQFFDTDGNQLQFFDSADTLG